MVVIFAVALAGILVGMWLRLERRRPDRPPYDNFFPAGRIELKSGEENKDA